MLTIKHESAWKFQTSSSGGIGVEFVAAEGGSIVFKDPSGAIVSFPYGAAGAGLTAGFKLPKIGKLALNVKGKSVGGVLAPSFFPNTGTLYVLDSFDAEDFKRSDITGVCMFAEVGGGVIVGGSATAMIVGMNPMWLAATLVTPMLMPIIEDQLLESATGLLLMAGLNAGIQAGAGLAAFLGGLF
jgi:hypothetical protein